MLKQTKYITTIYIDAYLSIEEAFNVFKEKDMYNPSSNYIVLIDDNSDYGIYEIVD